MKYNVTHSCCDDIDNLQHETIEAADLADVYKIYADINHWVHSIEPADKPLTRGDFDLDQIVSKDLDTSFNNFMGPIEPPDDYRIYNRKQADGTYPPLSKFFDDAVAKADDGKQEIDLEPLNELNWHNRVVFDIDAMAENARTTSAELKARIDERNQEAQERARRFFGH